MSTGNLIAEARRQARSSTYPESPAYINTLITQLADALEAAESPTAVEWGVRDEETGNVIRWGARDWAANMDPGNYPGFTVVSRAVGGWAATL